MITLARYWGIPETLDNIIFELHRKPTAALNKYFNWSMYKTARTHSRSGYAFTIAYLSNVAALLATSGPEKLDTFDKAVMGLSALIFTALGGWNMHKNYKAAKLAETREKTLNIRNVPEAFRCEEESLRDKGVREAKPYGLSFLAWSLIMGTYAALGAIDITDPKIIAMTIAATLATTSVFGPRYELKTGYKARDPLELLIEQHGGAYNAIETTK